MEIQRKASIFRSISNDVVLSEIVKDNWKGRESSQGKEREIDWGTLIEIESFFSINSTKFSSLNEQK